MRVATGGARRLLRPAMVAVVMATMAGTLLSSWSRVPWRDYLRRHPPSVVELSFVKPQTLPSQARAGALIQFGFKVANRRSERLTVGWTTQMESVDMRTVQTVATGVITAGPQQSTEVSQSLLFDADGKARVVVRLSSGQLIDFYVQPSPEETPTVTVKTH